MNTMRTDHVGNPVPIVVFHTIGAADWGTTGDIHTNMECQKGGGFGSKLNYHMIENPRKGGMKKQNSNNAMIGGGGFNKP